MVLEIGNFQLRFSGSGEEVSVVDHGNDYLARHKFAEVTSLRNNSQSVIFQRHASRMDRVDLLFDFRA